MKLKVFFCFCLFAFASCKQKEIVSSTSFRSELTKTELQDKIKGGWAGQVIGCSYGGPTEFKHNGTMIQDYHPIPWDENSCKYWYETFPGLYDDVYVDLTFVDVFEQEGLDAPATSHAQAFAHAGYMLWHANQSGRYNILNGINPPESGHWHNNPHADDIDFQIEADFAGLMSPGLINQATAICDKVGHIMNYGDGWYGGVYVAAMYSLAFVYDNPETVVREALKAIPAESDFYKCMTDVVCWCEMYPDDWKQTWFETERKWSSEVGCPDGVFAPFDIDAKMNAAYVVIGMLYGKGDFGKTIDISTRCGQDSDCNPATAAGILGTIIGYSNIPEYWKKSLYPVEDLDFSYTTMSLNDVYEIGYKHALQMLERNGVDTQNDVLKMTQQTIEPVALEIAFKDHFPVAKKEIGKLLNKDNSEYIQHFDGKGIVIAGYAAACQNSSDCNDAQVEVILDGQAEPVFTMPFNTTMRRNEVFWKYDLPEGAHELVLRLKSPQNTHPVFLTYSVVYAGKPIVISSEQAKK